LLTFDAIELATLPIRIAYQGEFFFIMSCKEDYPKNIISFDKQIELLESRGMMIEDKVLAKDFLKNISYFRLQGFWWEFQKDKGKHEFHEGVRFEDVIQLYTFDRKLRLLVFDALERIEIALRAKLVYYLSIELGQWWFEEPSNFRNPAYHKEVLAEIDKELKRTKEVFISSHRNKYGNSGRPPAYKTLEVVSLGCLSKLYSNLHNNVAAKDRIATEFNLPKSLFMMSWLKTFNVIRNITAHHSRLWNRNIDFPPRSLHVTPFPFIEIPSNLNSQYHGLSCILFVLNKVSRGHSINERLIGLFDASDFVEMAEMGFPSDWKTKEIWA